MAREGLAGFIVLAVLTAVLTTVTVVLVVVSTATDYTAAADGCLYSTGDVAAISNAMDEFYRCAMWHDTAFIDSGDWDKFTFCYWDFTTMPLATNNTAYAKVVALRARIEKALSANEVWRLRTTERIRLELALTDVRLVHELLDLGHFTAMHTDRRYYQFLGDYGGLTFETALVISNNMNEYALEADYETKVMGFLEDAPRVASMWYTMLEQAGEVNKTHNSATFSSIYADWNDLGDIFTTLCEAFENATACEAAATDAENAWADVRTFANSDYYNLCELIRPVTAPGLAVLADGPAAYASALRYHTTRATLIGNASTATAAMHDWADSVIEETTDALIDLLDEIGSPVANASQMIAVVSNRSDTRWYICTELGSPSPDYETNANATYATLRGNATYSQVSYASAAAPDYFFEVREGYDYYLHGYARSYEYAFGGYNGSWTAFPGIRAHGELYCNGSFDNRAHNRQQLSDVAYYSFPGVAHLDMLETELECDVVGQRSKVSIGASETQFRNTWGAYAARLPYTANTDANTQLHLRTNDLVKAYLLAVDLDTHGSHTNASHLTFIECTFLLFEKLSYLLPDGGTPNALCASIIAVPGRPASYYEGRVALPALRTAAHAALAPAGLWDAAEFHNVLTHWGSLTMPHAEALVATYVDWKKTPTSPALNTRFGIDLLRDPAWATTKPTGGRGRV